jgi:AcrR family transcriptional regulator
MPRHADPDLEARILTVAWNLWKKGGEKALTMRSVAIAAGTTTPTLYERFRNREEILLALLRHMQRDLFETLKHAHSPQEFCERYLDFAVRHPHEYELYHVSWEGKRAALEKSKPSIELLHGRLAEWLGPPTKGHASLWLAVWSLLHGGAMLLISKTIDHKTSTELRVACCDAVRTLVKHNSALHQQGISSSQ